MKQSQKTKCPYCAHEAEQILEARDTNNRVDTKSFDYYHCLSCDLVFIGEMIPDLGKYYSKDYAPYQRPKTKADLKRQLAAVQFRIDLVKRYKSGGSLLEIGPSYGAFALLAQESGFDVEVIEMDENCCAFIRDELGIKTTHSSSVNTSVQALDRAYDVIALWHNIEHLPQPWTTLEALSKRLNPGGILILSTPNPQALQFRVLKEKWVHLDAPRHLYLLPPSFVAKSLGAQGIQQVHLTSADQDSRSLTRYGWSASFKAMANQRPLPMFFARVFGKIFSWVFGAFEAGLRGSAYTGIYQKKLG